MTLVDLPPSIDINISDGGERKKWANSYKLMGKLGQETVNQVLRTVSIPCGYVDMKDESHSLLVVRSHGEMDVALAEGVSYLKPVIGTIVANEIIKVVMIPHDDAIHQIENNQPLTAGYDVTKTALAMLAQ